MLIKDWDETECLDTEVSNGPIVPALNDIRVCTIDGTIIDKENPKFSGSNLRQCQFIHHKRHLDYTGIQSEPSW
jgi:hypothetical protein